MWGFQMWARFIHCLGKDPCLSHALPRYSFPKASFLCPTALVGTNSYWGWGGGR